MSNEERLLTDIRDRLQLINIPLYLILIVLYFISIKGC